ASKSWARSRRRSEHSELAVPALGLAPHLERLSNRAGAGEQVFDLVLIGHSEEVEYPPAKRGWLGSWEPLPHCDRLAHPIADCRLSRRDRPPAAENHRFPRIGTG